MAQILGDCIIEQVRIIRNVNPVAEVLIWSDMLDPSHNAHADYYLVDGDFTESWNYVPQDLVIVFEVAQQVAVVRADIYDQIIRSQFDYAFAFLVHFSKVLSQDLGGAAGVGIARRKEDRGIYDKPELDQMTLGAVQYLSRVAALFMRSFAYGVHGIDRRQVAQKKDWLKVSGRFIKCLAAEVFLKTHHGL